VSNVVLIKHGAGWGLDEKSVESVAFDILKKEGLTGVELSLFFVGRIRAKKLNMKYRKMDYVPQVLSFPLTGDRDGDGLRRLGDIVICNERLRFEVRAGNKDVYAVLTDWLEHGLEGLKRIVPQRRD